MTKANIIRFFCVISATTHLIPTQVTLLLGSLSILAFQTFKAMYLEVRDMDQQIALELTGDIFTTQILSCFYTEVVKSVSDSQWIKETFSVYTHMTHSLQLCLIQGQKKSFLQSLRILFLSHEAENQHTLPLNLLLQFYCNLLFSNFSHFK